RLPAPGAGTARPRGGRRSRRRRSRKRGGTRLRPLAVTDAAGTGPARPPCRTARAGPGARGTGHRPLPRNGAPAMSAEPTIAIIDYGSGNLHSAHKAFERAAREAGSGARVSVTSDPDAVRRAERIVLPGV